MIRCTVMFRAAGQARRFMTTRLFRTPTTFEQKARADLFERLARDIFYD